MIFYLANNQTLCGTQADARALDRNFVQIDIPTDKAGLMAYVQKLMDEKAPAPARVEVSEEPIRVSDHTSQLVAFEDEWDNFPLARKAHFASLFCEEARRHLK